MKSAPTIDALRDGDFVDACYLIADKSLRKTRAGDHYITMTLCDETGTVRLMKFQASRDLFQSFEGFNSCTVRGRVENYNGAIQIKAAAIEPVRQENKNPADFIPSTPFDVDELEKSLRAIYAEMENAHVHALLLSFLDDPEILPLLKQAPAAKAMHHPVRGGLLEHVESMTRLARKVCEHYPQLDRDMLYAGVFFHDIGKIHELALSHTIDYSPEGNLVGHINIGVILIEEHAKRVEGFPAETKMLIQHMVLSHHGRLEYGSPKLPMTIEAQILHYIDNVDAKINACMTAVAQCAPGALWTENVPAFENRKLYKGPGTRFYSAGNKTAEPQGNLPL